MGQLQTDHPQHITVIGAGIVGVCCALWLRHKGHRVLLVDGNNPGTVTSCGNACTIAVYGCVPVNNPDLILNLPKLMFGKFRPLSVDPVFAARNLPWFLSFLYHCRGKEVKKINAALARILAHTYDGLDPLVELTGCGHLFDHKGCLYAYESENDFVNDQKSLQVRRDHGVNFTQLTAGEVQELEPELKVKFARGILFDNTRNVLNPQTLVNSFFEYYRQHEGEWQNQKAGSVSQTSDGLEVLLENGDKIATDKVVIASGAFSRQIEGTGAQRLPLGTERGYHVQFSERQHLVNRPVHWVGSGFYATPTTEGLRFAGTVELSGLSPKKNRKTLDYLTRMAKQMFEIEGEPDQTWLGYRPTLPDALPVIGASPQSDKILFAFGHQHLGLTLAGITGKIISELVDGSPTTVNITPFSAARFASA